MRVIKVLVIMAAALVMQVPAAPANADEPPSTYSTGLLTGNQIQVPISLSIGGLDGIVPHDCLSR